MDRFLCGEGVVLLEILLCDLVIEYEKVLDLFVVEVVVLFVV